MDTKMKNIENQTKKSTHKKHKKNTFTQKTVLSSFIKKKVQ